MFKSFGLVGSPALIRAVTAYYAEVDEAAEKEKAEEAEGWERGFDRAIAEDGISDMAAK